MTRTITTLGLALAAGLAVAACARPEKTATVPGMPGAIGAGRPLTPRPKTEVLPTVGGLADGHAETILLARQRLEARRAGPERLGAEALPDGPRDARPVSLAFNNLEARDALRVLIGELLGRNSVIDPGVQGQVTLEVDAELSTRDLYDLLDAVCVAYGWSVETHGPALVVRPATTRAGSTAAPILTARSASPSERPAVRVYPLAHIAGQQAADVVKALLSPGGTPIVAGRLLVVADTVAQLNRVGALIEALDIPAFDGVEVWTYELAHADPTEAARTLDTIAKQTGLAPQNDPLATFAALPGASRLMVIARDGSLQPMIRQWVEMVDRPPGAMERLAYVYRIQHLEPERLRQMLTSFYAGRLETNSQDPFDPGMRIVVEPSEELLLIRATPDDYADLMALLERIDRPRQQVHLQAVIAEVTLSDSLEYGVEYFLSTDTGSGLLELAGSVNQFSPANPAGSAVFLATDGFAVVNALKTAGDVAVLGVPSTTVRDNATADLTVGAEVPIFTASLDSPTQVGGTTGIRNEVEYRETGTILKVTPHINETGDVTMEVTLEVTDAVPTTSSGIDSPTFTTRSATTTVTVPHGHTVLIGGAIETRATDRTSGIPLLGDIPGVGLAFRSREKSVDRTELLLAVTPTIVNDPADHRAVMSEFLAAAAGIRSALASFEAPIPEELRTAQADAMRDAAAALTGAAGPDPAHATPAEGLGALASRLPTAREDTEAAAVALFLRGLARRAPGAG
ncbi:MAG: hypothetical protein D6693_08805 [Planctomycetota bacterium]|nr:MAG: hypothetical protein D6693_08805 [Planctomycetota bacterium]